jgi:hypothetical protein
MYFKKNFFFLELKNKKIFIFFKSIKRFLIFLINLKNRLFHLQDLVKKYIKFFF